MKTAKADLGDVAVSPEAQPLMVGSRLRVISALFTIAETQAQAMGVPIRSARVYQFVDPEEHDKELVLEVAVAAGAARALAYWQAVGSVVDTWKEGLSDRERSLLTKESSLHIVWEDGESVQPA